MEQGKKKGYQWDRHKEPVDSGKIFLYYYSTYFSPVKKDWISKKVDRVVLVDDLFLLLFLTEP